MSVTVAAQQPAPTEQAAANETLAQVEARLAERYERLELLAGRLAELSGSAQPRRAKLLRDLITQGRERDVSGQFERVAAALDEQRYSTAIESETALQADLERLLNLLLQEDRDRQLESHRKRIARYIQDMNRLIRFQRGLKARTEGGDDAKQLADDQGRVGDDAKKLAEEIAANESSEPKKPSPADGESQSPDQSAPKDQSKPGKDDQQGKPDDSQQGKPGESGKPSEQSQPPQPGAPSPPGQPSDSPGEPSQSQPGQGSPSEPEQSPIEKAAKSLQRARQRMQQAQQQLDEAKRTGAAQDQQRAIEQLEQAKAELERILRQLREEEMERMLVLLEARFRKMLDDQVAVYDQTKSLDKSSASLPAHELEIASGRLGRQERLIVAEADRALVLLREDGTSEAFPEAVQQARDDMQTIAERLSETKVEKLTQRYEQDVIAALEEVLLALRQALEKLRDQRSQPQPGGSGGAPGEQSLVDQLAELRMIRSLQMRINRRTQEFGEMIEGEQALKADLLEALDELAQRQEKIYRATRDLNLKNNK